MLGKSPVSLMERPVWKGPSASLQYAAVRVNREVDPPAIVKSSQLILRRARMNALPRAQPILQIHKQDELRGCYKPLNLGSFLKIEIELIYNVILVTGVQHIYSTILITQC